MRPDRLARAFQRDDPSGCAIGLLGLPFDGGIALNRGRVGAAEGPGAFREALARFAVGYDQRARRGLEVGVVDAGDVAPARAEDHGGDGVAALHATHDRVTEAVGALHEAGLVPVCVGGGHDLTLAGVRALAGAAGGSVGGVNVDAHMDVRPEVGSGMPFRELIEGGFLAPARFVEYGIGRFVTPEAQAAWARERGVTVVGIEAALDGDMNVESVLDLATRDGSTAFVSIDLDGIDGSQAPGVSAVNPMGLSVAHAVRLAEEAGRRAPVRHFDIMELSPPHDVDGRTARIAALLFVSFLAGFAERAG